MASRQLTRTAFALLLAVSTGFLTSGSLKAQSKNPTGAPVEYMIGPQDVLMITSYDQNDLTGKFAVEADGTFTYPLIGRVKAGGLTQRAFETALKKKLVDDGFFRN